jgi:eukaryotic-like serine/threonine-protein kinase
MEWLPGKKVDNGKYEIDRVLGRGGFGTTYKATHVGLSNFVAIKVPCEQYKEYFNTEIQIISALSDKSDRIVRVRDLFYEENSPCLVMDFIEGDNLFDLIQARQSPLLQTEAVMIISQIAEALTIIHNSGIVHRDINPKNIILQPDGRAVLIDFGIAKNISHDSNNSSIGDTSVLTKPRKNQYTKSFAPYEQILGENDCLPSVDVYSLSATLYYLLTKQYPETADNRKVYNCYLEPPKIYAQISDELNQAIINGMNVDANDRPDSIDSWLKFSKKIGNTQYFSQFNSEFEEEYKLLENFLTNKKWIDADVQTAKLMLKIADREIQGWMEIGAWTLFPCRDLKMIDKLWHDHSQGQFGFNAQRNLWKVVDRNWNRFEIEVEWLEDENIKPPKKDLYWYINRLTSKDNHQLRRDNQLTKGKFPTVTKPKTGILTGKIYSEKFQQQLIMELHEDITNYRIIVGKYIASREKTMKQYNEFQNLVTNWARKSELALSHGDEDLSLEALRRMQSYESTSKSLKIELEHMYREVDIKRQKLRALEFKVDVLKRSVLSPIEMLVSKLESCNKQTQ